MSEHFEHLEREPNHLERGRLLLEQRRYDLALREFQSALMDDPLNARAHSHIALCLLELGRHKEASQAAERAIEANPEYAHGYYIQAFIYRRRGLGQQARVSLDKALAFDPDQADFLGLAAELATDRKDWDAAQRLAEEGLAVDPQHLVCQNLRALAMIRKGQVAPARDALLELLSRHPDDPMTLANLGWVSLQRGERQPALDYFSRALQEDPEDDYARDGLLNAMRLQYPFYGLVLRYMLWMARLSDRAQWAVTMGLYFLRRGLEELARQNRRLAPLVNLVLWAMSIFNYMTWTARPLTSLLLRLNPYGRRILNQDEIDESNLVGLGLAGAGAFYALHRTTGRTVWLLASLVLMTIVLPACSIYDCQKGWRRTVMQVYTGLLLGVGVWGTYAFWDAPLSGPAKTLFGIYGIGLLAGQYLGNFLSGKRRKGED